MARLSGSPRLLKVGQRLDALIQSGHYTVEQVQDLLRMDPVTLLMQTLRLDSRLVDQDPMIVAEIVIQKAGARTTPRKAGPKKTKALPPKWIKCFADHVAQNGWPRPVYEHLFHEKRKWRFDIAWPEQKIAVEIEGGVWTQGRHTRGKGYTDDMEKYNAALLRGWLLLRYTPEQVEKGEEVADIREAFEVVNDKIFA